jgi:hypothetical protein
MSDTNYAEVIEQTAISLENNQEVRIERLRIKATNTEEIRVSWRKNGKMMPCAPILTESDFWKLVTRGIRANVLCTK